MVKTNTKRRLATRILPAIEARIIELSMQQPEFGAKRIWPLLRKENIGVSVSSIYNILKRHGLQNRAKRFAKIRAQQAREVLPQKTVEHPPPAEGPGIWPGGPQAMTTTQEEEPQPVSPMNAEKFAFHKGRPDFKRAAKKNVRLPLVLMLINISLLAALAFSGFHSALKFRHARQEPSPVAAAMPGSTHVEEDAATIAAATPLAEDSAIWKGDLPEPASPLGSFPDVQPPSDDSMPRPYLTDAMQHGASPWSFNLRFEELEASLADAERLLQEVTIDPYFQDNLPAGFTITDLKPDAIYKKMGLQNGDVIRGVNGEAVTDPEQALYFFQRVAEGGVVEIKIKRRRRTRYISLNVE